MTTLSRTTNDTFFIDNLDVRITESVSTSNWVIFGFLCSLYFLLCCFNFFVNEIKKNNKQRARNRIWCFYLGLQRWDVSMYHYVSSLHLSTSRNIYIYIWWNVFRTLCCWQANLKPWNRVLKPLSLSITIRHYIFLNIFKICMYIGHSLILL